jgi:hypothetical protein
MPKHAVVSVDGYGQFVCQNYPQIVPLDPLTPYDACGTSVA